MRVLLREIQEKNLCCMEVALIGYLEDLDELWFHSPNGDEAMIYGLGVVEANGLIHSLYEKGNLDLRKYFAHINEDCREGRRR